MLPLLGGYLDMPLHMEAQPTNLSVMVGLLNLDTLDPPPGLYGSMDGPLPVLLQLLFPVQIISFSHGTREEWKPVLIPL